MFSVAVCVCVRGGGVRGTAYSFFSRLYVSRLLRSPAQVRLLWRNFLKSSLKSSWCIGRYDCGSH